MATREQVDPETGEVLTVPDEPVRTEPLPGSVDELVTSLTGAEPDEMEVLNAIAGQTEIKQLPAEDSIKMIMAGILLAPDIPAVLHQGRAVGANEVIGATLTIHGVRWTASAYQEGPTVFAIIDATREDDGERLVVTCGSVNVMTQLWRVWVEKAFPIAARIVRGDHPSASGNYPLWLEATSR